MMDVWEKHGPPTFVGTAVMIGFKAPKEQKKSTGEQKHGTMADLAAMFGLGAGKKKAAI